VTISSSGVIRRSRVVPVRQTCRRTSSVRGSPASPFPHRKGVAHCGNSLHSFLPAARYVCREFLLIYIGQFVSSFGSAMTYVVLPFQMYALTHSTLAVGLIGVVEFAPMVAMALIGGALADHFDRRRLIGFVESAMTLCCAVLAWNASLLTPHVVVLWIIAGLLAGLGALRRPAMEALMQQVLPVSEMMAAGALNSVRGNFAFIVGPRLAGIIAATGGATAAFAVDGFSYVVSIAMIVMMRPVARMTLGEEGITWRALLEGWRYARGRQDLLGTYLIDINATFFGMPNALFPAMPSNGALLSSGFFMRRRRWAP
jgi:MFS family permease